MQGSHRVRVAGSISEGWSHGHQASVTTDVEQGNSCRRCNWNYAVCDAAVVCALQTKSDIKVSFEELGLMPVMRNFNPQNTHEKTNGSHQQMTDFPFLQLDPPKWILTKRPTPLISYTAQTMFNLPLSEKLQEHSKLPRGPTFSSWWLF